MAVTVTHAPTEMSRFTRMGPKGRLAKGLLAKDRTQRGLKHNETYRTPNFCTVHLPKIPLVRSNSQPPPAENAASMATSVAGYTRQA